MHMILESRYQVLSWALDILKYSESCDDKHKEKLLFNAWNYLDNLYSKNIVVDELSEIIASIRVFTEVYDSRMYEYDELVHMIEDTKMLVNNYISKDRNSMLEYYKKKCILDLYRLERIILFVDFDYARNINIILDKLIIFVSGELLYYSCMYDDPDKFIEASSNLSCDLVFELIYVINILDVGSNYNILSAVYRDNVLDDSLLLLFHLK